VPHHFRNNNFCITSVTTSVPHHFRNNFCTTSVPTFVPLLYQLPYHFCTNFCTNFRTTSDLLCNNCSSTTWKTQLLLLQRYTWQRQHKPHQRHVTCPAPCLPDPVCVCQTTARNNACNITRPRVCNKITLQPLLACPHAARPLAPHILPPLLHAPWHAPRDNL